MPILKFSALKNMTFILKSLFCLTLLALPIAARMRAGERPGVVSSSIWEDDLTHNWIDDSPPITWNKIIRDARDRKVKPDVPIHDAIEQCREECSKGDSFASPPDDDVENVPCTGFFYQKYTNGHQICGFYTDDKLAEYKATGRFKALDNSRLSLCQGMQLVEGAICFKKPNLFASRIRGSYLSPAQAVAAPEVPNSSAGHQGSRRTSRASSASEAARLQRLRAAEARMADGIRVGPVPGEEASRNPEEAAAGSANPDTPGFRALAAAREAREQRQGRREVLEQREQRREERREQRREALEAAREQRNSSSAEVFTEPGVGGGSQEQLWERFMEQIPESVEQMEREHADAALQADAAYARRLQQQEEASARRGAAAPPVPARQETLSLAEAYSLQERREDEDEAYSFLRDLRDQSEARERDDLEAALAASFAHEQPTVTSSGSSPAAVSDDGIRVGPMPSRTASTSSPRLSSPTSVSVSNLHEEPSSNLLCPISGELFQDPVTTVDGHSYERRSIERWFRDHDTSPNTGARLLSKMLIPNIALRGEAQSFAERHAV